MADEQTRKRLEALAGEPAALSVWVEELIEAGDRRLPEVAGWAVEQGNVVCREMRTVEVIRKALPTLGEAITARVRAHGSALEAFRPTA